MHATYKAQVFMPSLSSDFFKSKLYKLTAVRKEQEYDCSAKMRYVAADRLKIDSLIFLLICESLPAQNEICLNGRTLRVAHHRDNVLRHSVLGSLPALSFYLF